MKKEEGEPKITYSDLSFSLKVLVVFGWIAFAVWVFWFAVGFVLGYMGVV